MVDRDTEFADYFSARAASMRRLAYALCGDWHAAEDLVQVTFLRLYRHWRRIRGETLDAYARRTLVNAFLSERRGNLRVTVLAEPPDRPADAPDTACAIDLRRALEALTPRDSLALACGTPCRPRCRPARRSTRSKRCRTAIWRQPTPSCATRPAPEA